MSFLQTVGIASQASDKYDDERQARRMASQTERMKQFQLDEYDLYRGVVQHAIQYQAEQEAAREAAAKAAKAGAVAAAADPVIAAPTAPTAPGGNMSMRGRAMVPPEYGVPQSAAGPMSTNQRMQQPFTGMADGGPVKAESKFDGIYDDGKVGERLPSHYYHLARNWGTPGYKDGGMFHHAIAHITHHTRKLANGGGIDSNGVAMLRAFKNGGPICDHICKTFKGSAKAKSKQGSKRAVDLGNANTSRGPAKAFKSGGAVRGPGTGTSDSVPAVGPGGSPYRLSDGEYVLSADTVRAVGKDKLDALQARHHKKV